MGCLSPKTYLQKATESLEVRRPGIKSRFSGDLGLRSCGFLEPQMGSLHGSSTLPTFYRSRSPQEMKFTHRMVSHEEWVIKKLFKVAGAGKGSR